ncbi:MAG: hypothetical protein GY816_10360 [Cytophagales bacterium]|nr:hypothetical protein [Cytophagales bacterium]
MSNVLRTVQMYRKNRFYKNCPLFAMEEGFLCLGSCPHETRIKSSTLEQACLTKEGSRGMNLENISSFDSSIGEPAYRQVEPTGGFNKRRLGFLRIAILPIT